jgi:hypothetical protein
MLRETDNQICVSVDEKIKTIVVIGTSCPSSTLLSSYKPFFIDITL